MPRAPSPIRSQVRLDNGNAKDDIARLVERTLPSALPSRRGDKRKRLAFGWYGGKFSHLDWLHPLLPRSRQYCEPFGGSAAVLLNRDPADVETYNDLDGEVVSSFSAFGRE